jgi:hypothetical protein
MITSRKQLLAIDFKFFQRHYEYIVNYCIRYDISHNEFTKFTDNQKKLLKTYINKEFKKLGEIKTSANVWVNVPVMVKVYNLEDIDEIMAEALTKCSQDFDSSIFPEGINFEVVKADNFKIHTKDD